MSSIRFSLWGKAAFARADRENKPVFLLMEDALSHSSCLTPQLFADPRTELLLNTEYVSVRADRGSRPDLAVLFENLCSRLKLNCSYPLLIMLTPNQRPFYISSASVCGGPVGFLQLTEALAAKWQQARAELEHTADELASAAEALPAVSHAVPADLTAAALRQLQASFDKEYAGFGHAPKFPSVPLLRLLLRNAALRQQSELRAPALQALQQMQIGGIHDHFEGGFFRCAVDREWLIPCFEKPLAVNAMLASAYTEAWQDGHFALYRQTAEEILTFCKTRLAAPDGGYYTGLCADGPEGGTEGSCYLLTPEEVCGVLGEEAGKYFCDCYDITEEGNCGSGSIPNLLLNTRRNQIPEGYSDYRRQLAEYRARRGAPETYECVRTEDNALMLSALARACAVFGRYSYLQAAQKLAAFLETTCHDDFLPAVIGESRRAGLCAYAFFGSALLDLYAADYSPAHLQLAERLAAAIQARFVCPSGGFFDTADDTDDLSLRPQVIYDGEQPSGNCAAAAFFTRLARLTGRREWQNAAEQQNRFLAVRAGAYPAGIASALLEQLPTQAEKTVLCVSPEDALPEALDLLTGRYAPELTLLLKTPSVSAQLAQAAPWTEGAECLDNKLTFYLHSGGKALPLAL